MTIKALVEKKNALVTESEKMLEVVVDEVRALNEEEKSAYESKMAEIRELESTIEIMEKRSKQTKVQEVVAVEERGIEVEKKETIVEQEKRALADYMKGNITDEVRAMSTTSGNALVPTHLYGEVIETLEEVAPIYSMIPKLTPVNGVLEILRETNIGTGGFVGEMTDLGKQDFSMEKVRLEQRRAGSAIEISQQLINDSGIDIVSYAKNLLYRRLGLALDRAVINGTTGANSFEGLNSIAGGTNANQVEEVAMANESTVSITDFMNVLNQMHPNHQAGAVWIMSRSLFNTVSQLQDSMGNYYMIRQLNVVTGKPEYTLFGSKILINDAIQDFNTASSNNRIAYLVNMSEAFKGMIKKDMELKQISGDTQNALRGSHTFTLDVYTDVKCVQPAAVKALTFA